jgi:hypothetical protein
MNKKLNAFIRILTIVLAAVAVGGAFFVKGKMSDAITLTNPLGALKEIAAPPLLNTLLSTPKDFDARIAAIAKAKGVIEKKQNDIDTLETTKKELLASVADKDGKIKDLGEKTTALDTQVAELTRKRDEAVTQLTDANSKKDGAVAELATAKEELVKATEKVAAMFTKDQLAETEAKATKEKETAEAIRIKYVALHTKVSNAMDNSNPFGFSRDPLGEPGKEAAPGTAVVAAAVEAATESILTKIVDIDAKTGVIAFSVGGDNGIKEKALFDVKVDGKRIGKVQIASAKASLSLGQIQFEKDLDLKALARGGIVSLVPSNKLASN